MSQDYYGRNARYQSSWSLVNDDLNDDNESRYCASYATWSELNSQDVNEDQLFPQNNYSNGLGLNNNYGSSTIRQEGDSSPPEPEFPPSITASTRGFLELTRRYQRQSEDDIVGKPDEYYDYSAPPPQLLSDSNSDVQSSLYDSQSTVGNTRSVTVSSVSFSWSIMRYSLVVLVIGGIIYYIKDFPLVELKNIF